MLQRFHSRSFLVMVALGAGFVALSCGGGDERQSVAGPAPVEAVAAATDQGSVTASARPSPVAICHSGTNMNVAESAVTGHLKHGDSLGVCCPCFTKDTIDSVAATCSGALDSLCPVKYSLHLYCSGDVLGNFEAQATIGTSCSFQKPGTNTISIGDLSTDEYDACKALIVNSPYYPKTRCPQ